MIHAWPRGNARPFLQIKIPLTFLFGRNRLFLTVEGRLVNRRVSQESASADSCFYAKIHLSINLDWWTVEELHSSGNPLSLEIDSFAGNTNAPSGDFVFLLT